MKVSEFTAEPLEQFRFVKPVQILYNQDGKAKKWEAIQQHDSVAVLLYHRQKEAFLIVKQFRPPVYMSDKSKPHTYELCAGILDKKLSLKQIASEEIDEECGYNVAVEKIEKITSFYTNVGVSGAKQHLFFATIDEDQKLHEGGGINDEMIELEFLPLQKAKAFIYDESKAKTPGLMFAFYWFFERFQSPV